ncbi:MAG: PD-(D/E)XK nuclease family protein [Pseudomonadota bacterium]
MPDSLFDIEPLIPLVENGCTVLTPNWRLSRRIKAEWDQAQNAAGHRAWESLQVMPLAQWFKLQWQDALRDLDLDIEPTFALEPLQLVELWEVVISRDQHENSNSPLLRISAAAAQAAEARETLLCWQVDWNQRSVRQQFSLDPDCGTFLRWLERFEIARKQKNLATPADEIRSLLSYAKSISKRPLALVSFGELPPLHRLAIEALASDIHWLTPTGSTRHRQYSIFTGKREQLQTVSHWAANLNRENPTARIGIVLSDMANDRVAIEYLLRREFDCLGQSYTSLPVNFSTGITLEKAPLVRDALDALSMAGETTSVQTVKQLLRSRFLNLPDKDTPLAFRFMERLYALRSDQLDVAEVRFLAKDTQGAEGAAFTLGSVLMAIFEARILRQINRPSAWLVHFRELLELWGWPGPGPLDSMEYQQLERWWRTLDEFRHYDKLLGHIPFDRALALLKRCCSKQMSQPETADAAVQVLGPLEALGLEFDHLWITDMDATHWPAAAMPNPFIPLALQTRLDMPHASAQREWSYAEHLIQQYIGSCDHLYASYCHQVDDVPELPSPLLHSFREHRLAATPILYEPWLTQWESAERLYLTDRFAPPVTDEELSTMRGGSALIEDQAQCPFRAFARHRLHLDEPPAASLTLSPEERGSLLHNVLYIFWGHVDGHRSLSALRAQEQATLLEQAIDEAIRSFSGTRKRLLGPTYWQLEKRRLADLLSQWLMVERARKGFTVECREWKTELTLDRLSLDLKIDRIDRLPNGERFIIDYKSSVSRVQEWFGDRPAKPQLPLYSAAAPAQVAALAFGQVRPRDCKFVGLGDTEAAPGVKTNIDHITRDDMAASDWAGLNREWHGALEKLAVEFLQGYAVTDPQESGRCKWCSLHPLCQQASDNERRA